MPEAQSQVPPSQLTGVQKASVLLITLGAEAAANVMQHLAPHEIERLTSHIVNTHHVAPETRESVLSESTIALAERSMAGGEDFARTLLEQAVGGPKAKELLSKLTSAGADVFTWLRAVSPPQLASCIRNERPQIVALVIAYVQPDQAAQVLSGLPDNLQGEVALRLTNMRPTDSEFIKHVDRILRERVYGDGSEASIQLGGSESTAKILSNTDRTTEKKIMEYLTKTDEDIANRIKESMFVFEDILDLDDRAMQTILRDIPQDDLRLALKGMGQEQREVFYRNMSQRAADTLKEDLEASGPVKRRDVEAAQTRIANTARQLDEAGEISLRETEEDMVT